MTHFLRLLYYLASLRRAHPRIASMQVESRAAIAPGRGRLPCVRVEAERWVIS